MNHHYFAYRSFNPEFEAMKHFVGSGVDTICFFPGNSNNSLGLPYSKYPPIWCWYDQYNFDSLDRQIRDLKEVSGKIKLICVIDLNSPEWLSRRISLYRETGDIYLVADVLGHKDVNTTRRHYAAMDDQRRRKAAGAVHLRED